jgi:hypothetical protein
MLPMPVILSEPKITYTAVPKNACTSLKFAFYFLQNGEAFEPSIKNGKPFHIHTCYPSAAFKPKNPAVAAEYWKTAVLREPVHRLLSCYVNRVLNLGELDAAMISAEDLEKGATPRPSFAEFVEKMDLYRSLSSSIKHHTEPHVFFLGNDAGYYDRLFQMNELEVFRAELIARTGKDFVLQREQGSGNKMKVQDLSAGLVQNIKDSYKADYDTFSFQ